MAYDPILGLLDETSAQGKVFPELVGARFSEQESLFSFGEKPLLGFGVASEGLEMACG